mgnify:FL=1
MKKSKKTWLSMSSMDIKMLLSILKFMGVIASAIATLYVLYYSFWFICLIDNACYNDSFGV